MKRDRPGTIVLDQSPQELFRELVSGALAHRKLRVQEGTEFYLVRLLARESPAHTQAHVEYVHPRFRIGFQSMIGLDTVVARVPEGVTLGETTLDSTVLTGGSAAYVGDRRIGTTAAIS